MKRAKAPRLFPVVVPFDDRPRFTAAAAPTFFEARARLALAYGVDPLAIRLDPRAVAS